MQLVHDLPEHTPLLAPVDPPDNGPQVSLREAPDTRQEKDLFLNVGSEIKQLHDLCHAGSRHSSEAREFRIILNRLLPQQPLEPDGQRHQARDAGNGDAAGFGVGYLVVTCNDVVLSFAGSAGMKINCVCDLLVSAHVCASCPVVIVDGWKRIETWRAAPS